MSDFTLAIRDLVIQVEHSLLPNKNRALFHILTALRGPDFEAGDELKRLTTARIRAVVCLSDLYQVMVNPIPLTPEERIKRDKLLSQSPISAHFGWHYRMAVKAIHTIYGYDLLKEKVVTQK